MCTTLYVLKVTMLLQCYCYIYHLFRNSNLEKFYDFFFFFTRTKKKKNPEWCKRQMYGKFHTDHILSITRIKFLMIAQKQSKFMKSTDTFSNKKKKKNLYYSVLRTFQHNIFIFLVFIFIWKLYFFMLQWFINRCAYSKIKSQNCVWDMGKRVHL